ncbi:MAG: endonuclease MutS2 [Turicibacter sp.]|nr:endonuclease MutS2 [Turicibacter sp.]
MLNTETILEFDKIKSVLRTHCQTELGQSLVDELRVLTLEKQIKYRLNESQEALTIIRSLSAAPLGGATDITELVKRAEIGSILSAEDLLAIRQLLSCITDLNNFKVRLADSDIQTPLFDKQLADATPIRPLQDAIGACIDETGAVLDAASPELRGIRRGIHAAHGNVRERMQSILNSRKDKLTEPLITLRNGRFTLPVKAEFKNTFKGTIHDQSASGHTTYIEPAEVVALSNKLQALQVEERAEIERILSRLTNQVAEHVEALTLNVDVIRQLDFMFAKGRYAETIKGIMPRPSSTGELKLIQARHPLIDAETVVANDIVLASSDKAMVITGPNTGGKTVTLKTIGLLSLMMQSGLLVPAHESSEMIIFDHIFADIGDEQSIEQSLSTFSSHMTNIVHITKRLTPNSLVLFDELGAGTDPKEGASLAMAILDYVKIRAKLTVATSHFSELKAYAYDATDVVNASVEFNVETLSPTYRLLLGIPGRSNAFEISKKLGLLGVILDAAHAGNAANQTEVSELITKIEDKGLELDQLLQTTEAENKAALQLRKDYEEKLAKFEVTREKEIEKARLEGEQAVKEARETAERIVKELRETKKNAAVKDHELTSKLSELSEQEARHQEKFKKRAKNEKPLEPGDEVMVLSLARQGELVKLNKSGEWTVAMGVMTVNLKPDDLQYIKPPGKPKKKRNVRGGSMSVKGNTNARGKLDLRGERYEEAMLLLDQYFDQVMLANYDTVTIIHGHGTGAIRNGVQKYLRGKPFVAEFRYGGEAEGGMGATVVTLK